MALTAQEKADVIFYLGWPGKTLDSTSTSYSKIISDRLELTSDPMLRQVRGLLGQLRTLDTKITAASGRMLAKKIGDIELRDGEGTLLRTEKKVLLRELSSLVDIPLQRRDGVNVSVVA